MKNLLRIFYKVSFKTLLIFIGYWLRRKDIDKLYIFVHEKKRISILYLYEMIFKLSEYRIIIDMMILQSRKFLF